MELSYFFEKIEAHPELEGVGVDAPCGKGEPGLVIRHRVTHLVTRIPVEAVRVAEWEALEDVLTGKREPQALQHMTRVVGYFSRVENWNKSKVGELRDRRKGNYSIAG